MYTDIAERWRHMNFIVSATTDIGLTKKTNQDSYSIRVYNTSQGKVVLAILCDGMGGLAKGEVASASLVSAFCKWAESKLGTVLQSNSTDVDIRNEWLGIVKEYNKKIKAYGQNLGINLGTTLTAMLLTESKYYVINVGDTRAYEIYGGVRVITKDQTVVAREVELGNLTLEQAAVDPRRSVLLQCVGASEDVYPDFFFGDVKQNAVYMLCSDGFRHEITEQEIYQYLNAAVMNDADTMKRNMDFLIELNKQRQERDNISVVSVRTF